MPRSHIGGKYEKVNHPLKIFFRSLSLLVKGQIPLVVFVIFMMVISAGAPVIGQALLTPILNEALAVQTGTSTIQAVQQLLVIQAVLFACAIISSFIVQLLMVRLTQRTLHMIRSKMFEHMESLPISYFDQRTTGEIMSVYTNDTDTLRQVYSQACPQILNSAVQFTTSFIVMFIYSWVLGLISCAFLVLVLFTVSFIGKKSSKHFIRQQFDLAKLNGYIQEMTTGQRVIKVFNHEEQAKKDFGVINDNLEYSNSKGNFYGSIMMPAVNNIGYLCFAISAMVGGVLSVKGMFGLSATILASYMSLNKSFMMPLTQIASQINFVFQGLAGAKRVFDIMDEKPETDEGYISLVNVEKDDNGWYVETNNSKSQLWAWKNTKKQGKDMYRLLLGDIRFNNVTFSYDGKKIILNDISLYAKPGQKIAFVGATGAGKTTITNLLNRFYDIQSGEILYDGIDIKKIVKKDLRHSLAIVLQDTHLFTGTVAENIAYGCPDASREEIIKAAKLANADKFIELLPQGYDTVITGDGGNLSQGQKQLISIARASIMNPPVLILDEATSSIDTYTESLVQKGMDQLMIGRTTFAIAHRLSTVQNCNAIMVLDHGNIIERGNHEQLIALKGTYYQLYTGGLELE